jgi:hypothetical protein
MVHHHVGRNEIEFVVVEWQFGAVRSEESDIRIPTSLLRHLNLLGVNIYARHLKSELRRQMNCRGAVAAPKVQVALSRPKPENLNIFSEYPATRWLRWSLLTKNFSNLVIFMFDFPWLSGSSASNNSRVCFLARDLGQMQIQQINLFTANIANQQWGAIRRHSSPRPKFSVVATNILGAHNRL